MSLLLRLTFALLAGCGRLGFDGSAVTPDVAVDDAAADAMPPVCGASNDTHDEDRDGITDACDVCPHVADRAQANADGDGVGDLCDPSSATRERLVFFDPFTGPRPEWTFSWVTAPTYDGERMLISPDDLTFGRMPWTPGADIYILDGVVGAAAQTGARQIALQLREAGIERSYYCEMYEKTNTLNFSLTYTYDGQAFTALQLEQVPPPLENGAFQITLRRDPPDLACGMPWQGTTHALAGTQPADIAAAELALVLSNLALELNYLVVIRTE